MSSIAAKSLREPNKVFISYSRTDAPAKEFLERALCTPSEHEIVSLPDVADDPFSKPWFLRTKDRIRQADLVVCLFGEDTYLCNSCLWELTVAISLKKPIVAVRAHRSLLHIPPFVVIEQDIPVIDFDPQRIVAELPRPHLT